MLHGVKFGFAKQNFTSKSSMLPQESIYDLQGNYLRIRVS